MNLPVEMIWFPIPKNRSLTDHVLVLMLNFQPNFFFCFQTKTIDQLEHSFFVSFQGKYDVRTVC